MCFLPNLEVPGKKSPAGELKPEEVLLRLNCIEKIERFSSFHIM
jgi:hypothetical protein